MQSLKEVAIEIPSQSAITLGKKTKLVQQTCCKYHWLQKDFTSTLHICLFGELHVCAVSKRHLENCQLKTTSVCCFKLCLTCVCYSSTCSKQFFYVRVTVCGLCELQKFKDVCRYLGVVYHGTLRRNKLKLHNCVNVLCTWRIFFCTTAGFNTCSTHNLISCVNYGLISK